MNELIIVLDFGGQYNQLICRRVREENVYAEIYPYSLSIDKIKELNPKGIILTGGPNSVYEDESPKCSKELFELGIPVLGICYGAQLMAHCLGGKVSSAVKSEYGNTSIEFKDNSLFNDSFGETIVWMSHTDYIAEIPEGFEITSSSKDCAVASMANKQNKLYATQFHPEVVHSQRGKEIFHNFLFNICECCATWKMSDFIDEKIREIKNKVGNQKCLCALSGGVDSSVAAALMSKAIGNNLTCVFVDHGLLRKNEADEVENTFKNFDLNFVKVDAANRFYEKLNGITEPEQKRKIIGEEFIRVFEEEANKLGSIDFLVQGTIYPDVVESGVGEAQTIKSHHNVGGLPDNLNFKEIIEPLNLLFKDEVRNVGKQLGLPDKLINRQPFPGPGLGIRIVGEINAEKVKIVQDADAIYREEIEKYGLNILPNQYYAALTNTKTVGVKGDFRSYEYALVLRAVTTDDFMTADVYEFPWDLLKKISNRILNEVKGINRVFYDCTAKPPGTIELE